ncbi:hypothetical protein DESUT3_22960 [Desulfuromonas versatilis]|uniref:HTH OST-type domain-containing protein n=1 Tax=Desulfuromonas versatilis TaxID=2802975 RepID=A0ABM8HTD0_9BACT|nr:hypothetical protein [Desulfuromonas versatilis]BCR05227.1 hypothetical protein DESUT3_22960 [Desulfuromonas versatilis]
MGGFLIFLGLAGMAYFAYFAFTTLSGMEKDIRRELGQAPTGGEVKPPAAPKAAAAVEQPREKKNLVPSPAQPPATETVRASVEIALEEQILKQIKGPKGMLQTELYGKFPDQDRRHLQKVLAAMDADGTLKREKEKSTYRLFAPKSKKS